MTDFISAARMSSPAYFEDPKEARAQAVAVALEIIRARAGAATQHVNQLTYEFDNLSKYADQIQAAMESGGE
ncbi:hypothetical protein [Microbulbifer sp. VVAC002]|uniref:hypothetical protein n=1 Tax=Microbulbifer sp. VVAC002 TaxID=3243387 RepID=UPI0040393E95